MERNEPESENVRILRRCYEAFNRGDPSAFLDHYDDDIELYIPPTELDSGTYRGREAVTGWYTQNFQAWGSGLGSDIAIELRRVTEIGENIAVEVVWRGRGKRSGLAFERPYLSVVGFRNGKIAFIANFGGLAVSEQ